MAVGLEMDGQQRIWGVRPAGTVTPARLSHGRQQRARRRARLGGLGSAKRKSEGTRELGGRRGSRLGQKGGRRGRLERRPPWPTAKSSRTLAERALKSHETRKEMHGEREGTTASSPRAKIGGGDGSETAARAEVDGEIRRPRNDGCWGLRCVSGAKLERGSRGARGGARLPFNEAEGHEGGAPTTPGR